MNDYSGVLVGGAKWQLGSKVAQLGLINKHK